MLEVHHESLIQRLRVRSRRRRLHEIVQQRQLVRVALNRSVIWHSQQQALSRSACFCRKSVNARDLAKCHGCHTPNLHARLKKDVTSQKWETFLAKHNMVTAELGANADRQPRLGPATASMVQ